MSSAVSCRANLVPSAIAYGLIAAGISVAIIVAANSLGTSFNDRFGDVINSSKYKASRLVPALLEGARQRSAPPNSTSAAKALTPLPYHSRWFPTPPTGQQPAALNVAGLSWIWLLIAKVPARHHLLTTAVLLAGRAEIGPSTRQFALKPAVSFANLYWREGCAGAVLQMRTSLQNPRTRSRTGQSASRVVFVVACFLVMIATAWFISRRLFQVSAPEAAVARASVKADSYLGIIQLAPDQQGRCEQLEFDNQSAVLRSKGSGACLNAAGTAVAPSSSLPLRPPNSPMSAPGGTVGRMKGIGDYFKAH